MKTRTNQPIELANTQDIEHLSDSFLNELKAGDIITKQTGNQKHTYVVSYKEEKHGICLTYVDCGYMETISYDYTNGHWVFNSKDVVNCSPEGIRDTVKDSIENGTLVLYKDLDISQSLTPSSITGIETELKYCRIRISDDQILSIVLNFSVENTTEAQISLGNNFGIAWLVAEEIGKKIYDVNGDTIDETIGTYAGITSGQSFNDNGIPTAGYYIPRTCTMTNEPNANLAKFNFRDLGNISAGAKWEFTFRIFLTL